MNNTEAFVQREQYRIYMREYAGEEPAIVLMHGFPDNLHLYDRLIPYLWPPRRVVAFDFLGWGDSDKPLGYAYTSKNQMLDLHAVIEQRKLGQVVLVAHDASGPAAIDWALNHSDKVAALVLLNTYYCEMPTIKAPEAIWLFSTPVVRNVAVTKLLAGRSSQAVSSTFNSWSRTQRSTLRPGTGASPNSPMANLMAKRCTRPVSLAMRPRKIETLSSPVTHL
jgi:pimeloyl-ACP methyl ester carboxylesterase